MRAGYTDIFGRYYELLVPEELAALQNEVAELKRQLETATSELAASQRLVSYLVEPEESFW